MADELAKYAEVRIVGPTGSATMAPKNVAITEAKLKPLLQFLLGAQWQSLRQARQWRPDWVVAGSGLTAPLAWLASRMCNARVAVYVHGLDLSVQHALYRYLWLPAIRRMDRVIANSHATRRLAVGAGIKPERIGVVHPGVDVPSGASRRRPDSVSAKSGRQDDPASVPVAPTDSAGPRQDPGNLFRAQHGLGNRQLLLSVGRLNSRKGLREFVASGLPRILEAVPDVMMLIVGDAPGDALYGQAQTPESIQAVADANGVGECIKFLGRLPEADLLAAYQSANVHVFPIREIPGDPEGFGMVAVEAAAHGLPTVAFATGGVVDAVSEGTSGYLVASGDYEAFADTVLRTLGECKDMRAGCMAFARRFSWPKFGEQVMAQLASSRASAIQMSGDTND